MTPNLPFRWSDPHSWPWVIWVWLGMMALGPTYSALKWLRKQQAESWPVVDGRIEKAEAREPETNFWKPKQTGVWEGVLEYSYEANGERFAGTYKRTGGQAESIEFVRDMQSRPIAVHVNAFNPAKSVLAESDVNALLESKRPPTEEELIATEEATAIPGWAVPLLWPLIALSAVGLVASVIAHIGALMGMQVFPSAWFGLLFVGIFVVFVPMIMVAQKQFGNTRRKDFWKVAMKNAPNWMRYMVYGFFGYGIMNFLLFMILAPEKPHGMKPLDGEVRQAIGWRSTPAV